MASVTKTRNNRDKERSRAWTHHSAEVRASAIELCASVGPAVAAAQLLISKETVQAWWRNHRERTGAAIPRKRSYTIKFRHSAVELASKHGCSEAARLLKIPHATLDNWTRKAQDGTLPKSGARYGSNTRDRLIELTKQMTVKEAAKKTRVRLSTASGWASTERYRVHGPQQRLSPEERETAIRLANETSPRKAALELGIRLPTLKKWCSDAKLIGAEQATSRKKTQYSAHERKRAISIAMNEGLEEALQAFSKKELNKKLLVSWIRNAGHLVPGRDTTRADLEFKWIGRKYPEYSAWQEHASAWIKTYIRGVAHRLEGISKLIKYFSKFGVPSEPAAYLSKAFRPVDFYSSVCPHSSGGVTNNNAVSEFLDFVLLREFSIDDDFGERLVSPAFRNPVAKRSFVGMPKPSQSVYSPLPYGYINELRGMLASGNSFSEWTFAISAMGAQDGKVGQPATDWFEVDEATIDSKDPDCVHRVRENAEGKLIVEMWSPVRWVALITKLILPLRTFQVCVLDSGESDAMFYEGSGSNKAENWSANKSSISRQADGKRFWSQGVFRKVSTHNFASAAPHSKDFLTILYINTNKTADGHLEGAAKGYEMPWVAEEVPSSNVFFWLEKLRNWQTKYNPIGRRTSWQELRSIHVSPKSRQQLAMYPDACFLFRFAEASIISERHLPLARDLLDLPWYFLLLELERQISSRGETAGGEPVRLVNIETRRALFPMHALRVSLITSLALDGKLSLVVLQKLVGHSRLLMTLYYVIAGTVGMTRELKDATARMREADGSSIIAFLSQSSHDRLEKEAVFNDALTGMDTLHKHPAARNPAGWMKMHHGACLAGGNTSPLDTSAKIGGCYNGGPNEGSPSKRRYGPVPGGAFNCVRCRWFVTTREHLEALVGHFNVLMYHYTEAEKRWTQTDNELKALLALRLTTERSSSPFGEQQSLKNTERRVQSSIEKLLSLAYDLEATVTLVERCLSAKEYAENGKALIAVGKIEDVKVAIEPVSSELLQIAVACQSVEFYPDLEAGKAVLRQSQILDAALMRDGRQPFLLELDESDQLSTGNALMRSLALASNPRNGFQGMREVISLIDARGSLSKYLNADLEKAIAKNSGRNLTFKALAEV